MLCAARSFPVAAVARRADSALSNALHPLTCLRCVGVVTAQVRVTCRWRLGLLVAYGRDDGAAGRERAVAVNGTENWRLILEAARALTAAGQSPFHPGQRV